MYTYSKYTLKRTLYYVYIYCIHCILYAVYTVYCTLGVECVQCTVDMYVLPSVHRRHTRLGRHYCAVHSRCYHIMSPIHPIIT